MKYRNLLVTKIVSSNDDIHDLLKQHNIRDAILMLDLAWKDLSQQILKTSWSRISNWDEDQYDDEDNVPLAELFGSNSDYGELTRETHQLLLNIAPNSDFTVDDCEEWNIDRLDSDDEDDGSVDESDGTETTTETVPYSDAISSVNTLIKWCEENQQKGTKYLTNLLALRSDIVQRHFSQPKIQKCVTDYFPKST